MITHNGTYLLHATHHGMPIYAATMGGKMVFGSKWLLPLTMQAIVAAFGSEGTEVIRKTNDYLNRIAQTDPARALQLAGFINEDPLLVCSLVETSKTRWLVGDGSAKIITDVVPSANTGVKVLMKKISSVHNSFVFSAGTLNDRYGVYDQGNVLLYWYYPSGYKSTGVSYSNTLLIEYNIDSRISIKDISGNELYGATLNQIDCSGALQTGSSTTYPNGVDEYQYMIAETDGVENFHGVPMQRTDGTCGMLDIISGTFHPNANTQGSFTIAITDKTPA